MGATALLTYVALNASIGLGSGDMHCGFPAKTEAEPSFVMDVAPARSLFGTSSTLPVRMQLTTAHTGMHMAAVAEPLGPNDAPFVMIAGSPMTNVVFQLGLKDDGSASLTIRDSRKGAQRVAEVTRLGHCSDHESFFMLFSAY